MQEAREALNRILETHFCDATDSEKHESRLRTQTATFFQAIDLKRRTVIFKALADEKRLMILTLLTFREMCVCELTAALGLTQPNLSHHIKKLENAGLVKYEKRGKWVYYSLVDADILKKLDTV